MPAARPIIQSFADPTLLGSLAAATGRSQFEQGEQDRFDRNYARDLSFVNADRDRRSRDANIDSQMASSLSRLVAQGQTAPAQGVQTFNSGGRVQPGAPTRLQDAGSRVAARNNRSAQAVRQTANPLGASVRDPYAPSTGYGAVIGPESSSFSAGGNIVTSENPSQAETDYRAMSQLTGQPVDPAMLQAMAAPANAPPGGFVGPGQGGRVPQYVAQQLQVLQPYAASLLPADFQGLEAAVRSGQVDSMDRLINQIEDAQDRRTSLESSGDDRRLQQMTVREHQLEISRLRRHKAQSLANDPYGEVDASPYERLITRHQEAINRISTPPNTGESGSGGAINSGGMVVISNGTETFRIPIADLGAAQAEGFQELR